MGQVWAGVQVKTPLDLGAGGFVRVPIGEQGQAALEGAMSCPPRCSPAAIGCLTHHPQRDTRFHRQFQLLGQGQRLRGASRCLLHFTPRHMPLRPATDRSLAVASGNRSSSACCAASFSSGSAASASPRRNAGRPGWRWPRPGNRSACRFGRVSNNAVKMLLRVIVLTFFHRQDADRKFHRGLLRLAAQPLCHLQPSLIGGQCLLSHPPGWSHSRRRYCARLSPSSTGHADFRPGSYASS